MKTDLCAACLQTSLVHGNSYPVKNIQNNSFKALSHYLLSFDAVRLTVRLIIQLI